MSTHRRRSGTYPRFACYLRMIMVLTAAMLAVQAAAETVQYQIAASPDDTHCNSNTNYVGNDNMNFPYKSDAQRRAFFRWPVDIPAGATIESAYLKVKSEATRDVDSTIRLWLLDYDSCPSFSTNPYSWPMAAGASVDWVMPRPFTVDTWYTSPDITVLVQAFVDRPGYSEGSYLGMRGQWLSGRFRWIYQQDGGAANGAILEVEYVITPNVDPVADAGPDQDLTDNDDSGDEDVTLDGSASDDPDGTIVSYEWEENSVPIATGVSPLVTLSVAVHTIDLTVTDDDDATDSDSVVITVNPYVNAAPTVDAGANDTITLPANASLDGTVSDDGKPDPPATVTTTWTMLSGPGTVTFADPAAVDTTATFTVDGVYVLQLEADDSALSTADTMQITVDPATGGALTSTSSWQNSSVASHATTFTAEFDAVPHLNNMDGITGFSDGPAGAYSDVACIFRFNTSGELDVRNGGGYTADATIAYAAGVSYHVRMEIDVVNHVYDVFVTPAGQGETQLAAVYAFRTEQAAVASLDNWTLVAEIGSHTVSNMTVNAANVPPTADAGPDQEVNDADDSGDEDVTLDGSGSSDSDGTIVSYVWEENSTQIATGVLPVVTLSVAVHTIDLTVTDDDDATDADTVVVTVNAAPSTTTVQYQIAGDYDDTHCNSDSNYVGNDNMNFPYTSDTQRRAFFRWAVDIPAGATVESAYLKVRSYETRSVDSSIRLWLLDYDDCPSFSTNPYSWPMAAGTSVDWVMPNPFTLDTWYTSPDIKAAVQAFVDRPGYSEGSYLGMRGQWLSGSHRWIYQHDGDAASAAILAVTYSTGGPPVNDPPTADAGPDQNVDDTDDSGDEDVTLDGSGSSDSDGTIVSYVWEENSTQIATGVSPLVTLSVAVHTIDLTVTDDDSDTDTDSVQITVAAYVNVPPTADAGPDQEVNDADDSGDEDVTLDGSGSSDSDGTIVSYVWEENSTQIATGVSPIVTLSVAVHTIDLIVTDDDSDTDTDSVQITVTAYVNVPPTADAGPDQLVHDTDRGGDEDVTLDGSGSSDSDGTIVSYEWEEASVPIASGVSPVVTLAVGAHTIDLTVTDDDSDTDSDSVAIEVNDPPVADAGTDQNVTDNDDNGSEDVTLDGSGSSDSDGTISSYIWEENSIQIATGVSPLVTMGVNVHTVDLTVTDDDAATATDSVVITVNAYVNVPPTADAGPDQNVDDLDDSGDEDVTLDGSGSSDSDGTIVSYEWEEASVPIATGVSPLVTLSVAVHTIDLIVTDDDSDTDTDTVVVTINAAPSTTTVQYQIAGTYDDTHCSSDDNHVTNDNMNFPYTSDAQRRAFFRWSVDIPVGATIESAYLKVKSEETRAVDSSIRLWLLDYDDCPSFSTNPFDWPMAAGTDVDWVMPNPFTIDTWYTSPDLKTLVQAFVDRPGYSQGNYLGMRSQWLSGSHRWIYQYDSGAANAAVLEVTYSTSGGGGNLPPVADAGPDQNVTDNDDNGYETVILDGSGSSDPDGTITDYDWYEGATPIATGATPQVDLNVNVHTLTLEVTDNDLATDTDTVVVTVNAAPPAGPDYYIDFDGGSDANIGTSPSTPWKHCPGDSNATGNAAATTLVSGDTVIFKGGVHYRGQIGCNWSGSVGSPITYDGNTAGTFGTGQATIDGSDPMSGWTQCQSAAEAGGNPNWANIWYAYAPAGTNANTSNLYQYNTGTSADEMCWLAQEPDQPDPFFMDKTTYFYNVPWQDVTTTSLTDSARLTQGDPDYWDGAYVMVWRTPNMVDARAIETFNPSTDTITYAELDNVPYDDRDGLYAIYNHISLLDEAGEYYFNDTAEGDGTHNVWLWPPAGNPNTNSVSVSVPTARDRGFRIYANIAYLTFDGLRIEKYAGGGLYGGGGINHNGSPGIHDITIVNCDFAYIRHDYRDGNGYGAIALGGTDVYVADNTFFELPVTNAMQLSITDSVVEDNYVERPGRHGLWMNFHNVQILGNTMLDVQGTHADGIAVFNGSSDVTLMYNTILNSGVPICTQNSSNVTVAYNYLHCPSHYAYADYGGCANLKVHNNTLLRNDEKPSLRNDSGGESRNNIAYTYAGQGSLTPDGNGNLTINHSMDTTVFNDPAGGDYSLKAGSPAIDAGVNLGYTRDVLGVSVPQGDAPDIGAFELPQ